MKKIRCNRKMFMYVAKVVVTCLVPGMIFTGCLNPVTETPVAMELSPATLDFTWSGGEQSFDIMSNASKWSVSSSDAPRWLTVSPSDGFESGKVTITADENISATQRTATITVTATGTTRTIDVTQAGVSLSEPEMALVQGGTFTMGCTSTQEGDCRNEETPAHHVTISDFYIGKYEITQAQWKAVMDDNPSRFKGDNLPVENVSWNEVQTFITKLNRITGKQYRLPTEAEWEYASLDGNNSTGYRYSGSNTVGNVAWYRENSNNITHAVGTKSPNELGIYDMSGNVSEWCSDWWYGVYDSSTQTNPQGPPSGSRRVSRGGNWENPARDVRVYARTANDVPDIRYYALGFRVALSSR